VYVPPARPPAPAGNNTPPRAQPRDPVTGRAVRDAGDTTIRVLLSHAPTTVPISAPGTMTFSDRTGGFVARAVTGGTWRVERQGRRVRAIRPDGSPSNWAEGALYARSGDAGLLSVAAKPYRGDILFAASDSGIAIVNVVKIDDYLRGVVPLEIGTRSLADSAAVQAQAITARSYAYIHLAPEFNRAYDVTAGTQDQVYGGVAAETEVGSQAVESTRTLVLKYGGRVVNAPYSSTCGGSTAAASEIWRSNDEPYLQRVSDQIPGTGRYYCDISPRYRWTRTIEGAQLDAALAQYLANYASVPNRRPGSARNVGVSSHTPSGRVGTLVITTDRGNFTVRGNDTRYVLRPPGGEILNSTYFSVLATPASDGSIARLTINGMGYGHGVGMCQWGAIGRARAGQDARTILRTYYPGTTVGSADQN
jgi:stage II sporulation protein D